MPAASTNPADPNAEKKQQLLDLMANGNTLTEACQVVGVDRVTVWHWRMADSEFERAFERTHHTMTSKIIADYDRKLGGHGLTRRERRLLKWKQRAVSRSAQLIAKLNGWRTGTDAVAIKKERRLKASARKLRWLATKDFNSLSPEARRAAEQLLRSKLAGEILRA